MTLGKRIQFYGFGLLIGLAITFFMFNGRSCDWLPGNRVKTLLQERLVKISDYRKCELECNGLNEDDVFRIIEKGEVSFSESQTKGDLKEYVVTEGKTKLSFLLRMVDTVVFVNQVVDSKKCYCDDLSRENDKILFAPNDLVLKRLKENGYEENALNICLGKCMGIDTSFIRSVLDDGLVIPEESYPQAKPNPVYWIQKMNGRDTLRFKFEQGTKSRVLEIRKNSDPNLCDC